MKSVLVLTPFGYCRLCEFGLIIKPLCTRTDLGCKEPTLCKKKFKIVITKLYIRLGRDMHIQVKCPET